MIHFFYKFVNLISVPCQLGITVDQYGPKLNFPQSFQFNLQQQTSLKPTETLITYSYYALCAKKA